MASPEIEIKGTTFTISVVHLTDADLQHIKTVLEKKMAQAPNFFESAPVIVNISQVNESIDFAKLNETIKATGFIMVGITGCKSSEQKILLHELRIPVLVTGHDVHTKTDASKAPVPVPPKIVRGQVRSGQQVYAKNCDLIIIGSVSNGAEIIADGSIHVYGALRGRAIAGANGQTDCAIFCQNLQAELISVAGHYQLSESLQPMWKQACYIELDAQQLKFATLNQ
ncbi:MAG: Septum site-determining protein MinC [Candidatus Celerinatantimonas neptuna]|nr:MAG: Septum site-determining protein MinC [Candidatus Celerinatantimonas neptuna]